ncbi:energy transducer TonB [Labilibaculum sp.]|uniref:energy transducer TonB family protein n=1 Tax=Labilibaculum sp. TaxID=2060723 RepID=UPI00356ABFD9
MGTIAFHMFLLILMLLFKLNTKKTFLESEISIEIPLELSEQLLKEEKEKIEEALEEKNSEISKSVDELLRSIAVNQNVAKSQNDPQQKVDQLIDEVRKDLDELGSDDAANGESNDIREFLNDSISAAEAKEKQKLLDSLESIEYSGPSSVYYNLEGRHKVYLPIPVFKCEGEGLIAVQIVVNQSGRVIQSSILNQESGVQDDCLFDAALQASRKTRFNVSTSSPAQQIGKITYQFVRQ